MAGCARQDATLPVDQPASTGDTGTDDVGTDDVGATQAGSSASDEIAAGLASAGMHTEGLLRGVPTTCRLVDDASGATLDAATAIGAELGDGFGPLVVVDADDEAVIAATRPGEEGPTDLAAWVVTADGGIASISGTGAEATSFDPVAVDTAGEGPRSYALGGARDCSWTATDRADTRPEPPRPSPEIRPDLVTLAPDPAPPDANVDLSFPTKTGRGVAFQLDRDTDDGWEPMAWMTSDANGGEPVTVPAFTNGYGVDGVGIGGPGPDTVALPEDLAPGAYRICTANRGDPEICAELTVS